MSSRHPIAVARGRGSAKSGVHHWFAQRASAVLLVLLVAWLFYAAFALSGAGFAEARAFVASPLNATLAILLLSALFYHAALGLQVVIEDYVHSPAAEWVLHFLVRAGALLGAVLGVVYVLKIALGA